MIHPRHPSTEESCYMTTHGCIYYSFSRLKHINPSVFQMLSPSLWLKISSLPLCLGVTTNVLSTSAQLYCFVLYLESFKVQYLLNCIKVTIVRTMVQMACQQWTSRSQLVKAKKDSAIIVFNAWFFYHSIPRISFSFAGVQKYQPIIWANRNSYYYHRLYECISENLLFPYYEMELPCPEVISEYKVSIHIAWDPLSEGWRMVFRFHGKEWAAASLIAV